MKTLTLNNKTIGVIDVPEGVTKTNLHIHNGVFFCDLGDCRIYGGLPPGSWQILGRLNEISEEQARELIDYKYRNLGFDLEVLKLSLANNGIEGNPLILTKTE